MRRATITRKTAETDGYEAVQVGLVEDDAPKANKAANGHFQKAGVAPMRHLAEFPVEDGSEAAAGDQLKASVFSEDDYVDVAGTSKGKGFQGVIKRHGFGGGRATHGSMFHRAPGSIGRSATPSRVFPGQKLRLSATGSTTTSAEMAMHRSPADPNPAETAASAASSMSASGRTTMWFLAPPSAWTRLPWRVPVS